MNYAMLEKDECAAIVDFIECDFLPYVQNQETEVDNIEWIALICSVWKKCKKVANDNEHTD